ncbi:hypothetical protein ACHAW5_003987 [Stephanodiscus triporus]|uniref:DUF711 family protein n=1 Tax=Stephanodiscus triporus TaxID=2934178 RepID=A0ABD3MJW3_9STRA
MADGPIATTATAKRPFRIRTITAFVTLRPDDFDEVEDDGVTTDVTIKVDRCADILRGVEAELRNLGYDVQTARIATNPFGEWLIGGGGGCNVDDDDDAGRTTRRKKHARMNDAGTNDDAMTSIEIRRRLLLLDGLLDEREINFCSLGPSTDPELTARACSTIVSTSGRFSCSANVEPGDVIAARAAAACMKEISTLDGGGHVDGGLGNFRFCSSTRVAGAVPFFPGARAPHACDRVSFAIGLENGGYARLLLEEAGNIGGIKRVFDERMSRELMPVQEACSRFADGRDDSVAYLGIDTSLNPSLDDGGSVADAIECLEEVRGDFGGTGSMAAAAAITTSLQSIPGILTTGYCGLMLPVLEDKRLAELGMAVRPRDGLTIERLLCISSVCGVGVDTVPIPGDVSEDSLSSLILDVAALAGRWNKPLSCRVFPVPGGAVGEMTSFDSPYMCNSRIFGL